MKVIVIHECDCLTAEQLDEAIEKVRDEARRDEYREAWSEYTDEDDA